MTRDATGWVLAVLMAASAATLISLCWIDYCLTRRAHVEQDTRAANATVTEARIDDDADQLAYDLTFNRLTAHLDEEPQP